MEPSTPTQIEIPEVLLHIFKHLDSPSIYKAAQVNRLWKSISNDYELEFLTKIPRWNRCLKSRNSKSRGFRALHYRGDVPLMFIDDLKAVPSKIQSFFPKIVIKEDRLTIIDKENQLYNFNQSGEILYYSSELLICKSNNPSHLKINFIFLNQIQNFSISTNSLPILAFSDSNGHISALTENGNLHCWKLSQLDFSTKIVNEIPLFKGLPLKKRLITAACHIRNLIFFIHKIKRYFILTQFDLTTNQKQIVLKSRSIIQIYTTSTMLLIQNKKKLSAFSISHDKKRELKWSLDDFCPVNHSVLLNERWFVFKENKKHNNVKIHQLRQGDLINLALSTEGDVKLDGDIISFLTANVNREPTIYRIHSWHIPSKIKLHTFKNKEKISDYMFSDRELLVIKENRSILIESKDLRNKTPVPKLTETYEDLVAYE